MKLAEASKALTDMSGVTSEVGELKKGLGAMVGVMMAPKRKAKSMKLKKGADRKTQAVMVEYDDGTSDEMPVGMTQ